MGFRILAFCLALCLAATDLFAVNWGKAMNMYYQDFDPVSEMLFTLGGIVLIGVATYYYQKIKKQRYDKRMEGRKKNKDFNDLL